MGILNHGFVIFSVAVCLAVLVQGAPQGLGKGVDSFDHSGNQGLLTRLRRDVVETAKSVYNTVTLGTKAVFNDLIGNNHVAQESYRQAKDESQKVAPAFQGIFVNPNKVTQPPGPPPKTNEEWNAK